MGLKILPVLLTLLMACAGTRTGNPAEEPPSYESSTRFSPEVPGDSGEVTSGPPVGIEQGSEWAFERPLSAAFLSEAFVVGAGGGLLVVMDVGEPEAPALAGYLEFAGLVLQMEVVGDGAVVAVRERAVVDADEVPEPPPAAEQTKLVYVDLSDPAKPRRVAEVALEGTFVRFDVRGDRLFALQALPFESEPTCGGQLTLLPEAPPRPNGMRVTSHRLDGDLLAEVEALPLAADAGFVWASGDAYFVLDGFNTDSRSLSWVDFSGGALVAGAPLAVDARPSAVARQGGTVAVLVEPSLGGWLRLFSVTADGSVVRQGRVGVPDGTEGVTLSADGTAARMYGTAASLVDLADPTSPVLASQLPVDVARLIEVPAGLLGLGVDASGGLVATLWDASDLAAPVSLARVEAPVTLAEPSLADVGFTLSIEHELLLLPFMRDGGPFLGALRVDAAGFGWHSDQAARQKVFRPLTDGAHAYGVGTLGFEVFPLVEGASEAAPVSAALVPPELAAPLGSLGVLGGGGAAMPVDPRARVELDGYALALREREDGISLVDVTSASGGDTTSLELPHHAEALIVAGERVVALGFNRYPECGLLDGSIAEVPNPAQNCGDQHLRGASVLTLDGTPAILTSTTLEPPPVEALPDGVESDEHWRGYHTLADGRVLLFVQRFDRCDSQELCDVLGVPAYESFGSPGCNPETQDCTTLPSILRWVSGHRATLRVLLLDGAGGTELALTEVGGIDGNVQLFGEPTHDVAWQLLHHGDSVAVVQESPIYGPDGNSIPNAHGDSTARYYLHRIEVSDEAVKLLAPINTPGRPVVWLGDTLLSLDPGYDADGEPMVTLRRSALHDGGAFIEDSLEIGTGFLHAQRGGDLLWVLRGTGDPCAGGRSEVFAVAVDSDPLEASAVLGLPGWQWYFERPVGAPSAEPPVLRGGPLTGGYLTLDATDPNKPRVERYVAGKQP